MHNSSGMSRGKKKKYRIQPGASPGTLAVEPGGPKAAVVGIGFGPDGYVEKAIVDLREITALSGTWPAVWIHVTGLKDIATLNAVQSAFGLHNLAMEDVVNQNQRSKMETYDDHNYLVVFSAEYGEVTALSQVNLFLGDGFVVSIAEAQAEWEEPVRRRIKEGRTRFKELGAPYLAYAIIDAVVDHYFPVLDSIADKLGVLESAALRSPGKGDIVRLHHLGGELMAIRRALAPLKDLLGIMVQTDHELIHNDVRIYFRDAADHTAQLLDEIDMDREIVRSLVDTSLSSISNRMNEVIKVLTIISTIFIPLSFIAAVYGMNFDPDASPLNMPELRWAFGYPSVLALMLLVSGGLMFYFYRNGWLGSRGKDV